MHGVHVVSWERDDLIPWSEILEAVREIERLGLDPHIRQLSISDPYVISVAEWELSDTDLSQVYDEALIAHPSPLTASQPTTQLLVNAIDQGNHGIPAEYARGWREGRASDPARTHPYTHPVATEYMAGFNAGVKHAAWEAAQLHRPTE